MTLRRRTVLAASASAAGAALLPLAACTRNEPRGHAGGWVGANAARGHRLREGVAAGSNAAQHRTGVLVIGAGIAGLATARSLVAAGIDDVRVLELEDEAGGNSRGHTMGGMACPLGAHYLPVPGEYASEVAELLDAFGLRRTERGQVVYDEFDLCHSPQERIYIDGHWHEGLLPPLEALPSAQRAATREQYRRFAKAVDEASAGRAFAMPTARSNWSAALDALDAQTFAAWLDAQHYDAPALRWYLDYCCRDDYGAGAAQVSAWAGLHYFASRHGFHAPGDAGEERDGILTWPEGNARLSRKLAGDLGERIVRGSVALRVEEEKHAVRVDVWNDAVQRAERWSASQVIVATPLFVAARLLDLQAPGNDALKQVVGMQRHAPWLVGNLQLRDALDDRPGAPLSWDNVYYEAGPSGAMLGYVDAMHQSTRPYPGPTVITSYWALGGNTPAELRANRTRLLEQPWQTWADAIVADLARAHPDLPGKIERIDLMRYGHAMSIPVPGLRSSAALRALSARPAPDARRVHFAHADLSSYSVFEEALYHGRRAAQDVILQRRTAPSGAGAEGSAKART